MPRPWRPQEAADRATPYRLLGACRSWEAGHKSVEEGSAKDLQLRPSPQGLLPRLKTRSDSGALSSSTCMSRQGSAGYLEGPGGPSRAGSGHVELDVNRDLYIMAGQSTAAFSSEALPPPPPSVTAWGAALAGPGGPARKV